MKKRLLASVATLATVSAFSAFAADLPSRKAAPVYAPPPPMWTGFYAGLNAGATWANNSTLNVSSWPLQPGIYASTASFASGAVPTNSNVAFLGGGQIGYNWQVPFGANAFVTGVEADIQGSTGTGGGNNGTFSSYPINGPLIQSTYTTSMNAKTSLSYIGTVRGRIGYLATPTLLVYGTGGLAYGGVNVNLSMYQNASATGNIPPGIPVNINANGFANANYSNTNVGWAAGGGVEWMFMPNWSAKAEYLYYDLGNVNLNTVMTATEATLGARNIYAVQASTRFNGNIVRAGVNYHFNWGAAPVVAKY